jgi:DNA invertase Pin-like site-specific DNA recombinase
MKKAVAYIRWSSDDQSEGHSIKRQTDGIAEYARRNGLEISETIIDDGRSAFTGEHIAKGEFGKFLKRAGAGKYRGFALIAEDPDRLTRQGYRKLLHILEDLLAAGIEIHFTMKNMVIRSEEDLDRIEIGVTAVIYGANGREHSAKLSTRLEKVWADKKRNSAPGVSITARLPAWLEGEVGESIRVNEEKAAVVREIFEMAANGMGKRLIARELNRRKVPTFGWGERKTEEWLHGTVQKILTNRAVLGEYQPRKKGQLDGEPRIDFFPPIVSRALFDKVASGITLRRTGKTAGRTGKLNSLFSGLIFDKTLGRPMHYATYSRGRAFLETNCREVPDLRPNKIDYSGFEEIFLTYLDELDWTTILDISEAEELKVSEEKIATLGVVISSDEADLQKVTDLLIEVPAKTLKERLLMLEARLEKRKADRAAEIKKLEEARRKYSEFLDKWEVYATLSKAKDLETRSRLRQEIRRKVARIEFDFAPSPNLIVKIYFVNGAEGEVKYRYGPDGRRRLLIAEG